MTDAQWLVLCDAIQSDPHYNSLLKRCCELEGQYIRIRNSLPEKDREIVESYITACEELEFRRTCLAMKIK